MNQRTNAGANAIDTGILLETGTNELEILEFHIEEESEGEHSPRRHSFGVNVAKVKEVIESPRLDPQPGATHPSFRGIIPLRGSILPVIDLAVWLGIAQKTALRDNVIVTEFSKTITGFVVSGVTGIHRVGWAEVIPPDGYMPKVGTQAIIGLVEREGQFIQLLDLETIIADLSPDTTDFSTPPLVMAQREIKALVADDSATIRLMLKKTLERSGISPTIVGNGQEALTTLRDMVNRATAEQLPISDFLDILISDIEMPLMDGFSLTKYLRNDPTLRHVPVVLYSSIITDELRHKGESVGADVQLAKPDLERLPEAAMRLVAASDAKRSLTNV